ncbi:MAG: hypothetical protein IPM39_12360 [Chloroflexi bacterium]|nr:hypothetical protein [Chloroflexota bacterium]
MSKFAKILLLFLMVTIGISAHKVTGAKDYLNSPSSLHNNTVIEVSDLEGGGASINAIGCSSYPPKLLRMG